MNRLLPWQTDELTRLEVEVVGDVRDTVTRDNLEVRRALARNHLRILEIGDVNDSPESRGACEDLVGMHDERGVLIRIDDHWGRGMGRPKGSSMERRDVI